jgi:hypothetical protein
MQQPPPQQIDAPLTPRQHPPSVLSPVISYAASLGGASSQPSRCATGGWGDASATATCAGGRVRPRGPGGWCSDATAVMQGTEPDLVCGSPQQGAAPGLAWPGLAPVAHAPARHGPSHATCAAAAGPAAGTARAPRWRPRPRSRLGTPSAARWRGLRAAGQRRSSGPARFNPQGARYFHGQPPALQHIDPRHPPSNGRLVG